MVHTNALSPVLNSVIEPTLGVIDPVRLAVTLRLTMSGLASIAGIHRNTLSRSPASSKVQERLGSIVQIIGEAAELMGGDVPRARFWFMHQPLAGFEGETAADIVRLGKPSAVRKHLQLLRDGGYA